MSDNIPPVLEIMCYGIEPICLPVQVDKND